MKRERLFHLSNFNSVVVEKKQQKKVYLFDKQPPFSSQCRDCKHVIDLYGACFCKAFPDKDGIPIEILYNERIHSKVIQGQTGNYILTKN